MSATTATRVIDPTRYVVGPDSIDAGDIDLDEVVIHNAATGERVTEAMLEAEAIEMEKTRPWLIPGGKSLSGGTVHSPTLRTVVSEATAEKARAKAKARRMSLSKYIRGLIERDLQAV